jgi:hypothetical protein
MKIKFPNKTAKEIAEEYGITFWSNWFINEDFYTKEKCRGGTFSVSDKVKFLGISGKDALKKKMLNLAESIYYIVAYKEKHSKYPDFFWTWTSSKWGARLVYSYWNPGSHELHVYARDLTYQGGILGVRIHK